MVKMDGGGHGKGQSGRDGVTKPKTRWEIKCDRADKTEKDLEVEKKKVPTRLSTSDTQKIPQKIKYLDTI